MPQEKIIFSYMNILSTLPLYSRQKQILELSTITSSVIVDFEEERNRDLQFIKLVTMFSLMKAMPYCKMYICSGLTLH